MCNSGFFNDLIDDLYFNDQERDSLRENLLIPDNKHQHVLDDQQDFLVILVLSILMIDMYISKFLIYSQNFL